MESTPSDELIHSDQIELLKLLCLSSKKRSAVCFCFYKFLELQETFSCFLRTSGEMQTQDFTQRPD